ncbi:hypothetical protein [Plesiocystis pacifica]|uniref:hypothetical protein n=1 Tax=Plesiocystis pacifica TaxID=191768 RepID=UPI0012FB14AE|nr:hypothetical protein [Plesiocystis pacifica]
MSIAPFTRGLSVLALVVLFAGCDPEPPSVVSEDARVELGAAGVEWRPLAEGDPVELVAGLQGGWHVDVAVRGRGLEPSGVALRYEARAPGSEASMSFVTEALLNEDNVLWVEGDWLRPGGRVVFDIAGPEEVVGAEVCLLVTASADAWMGEDSRCVTVVDELP